jgi:hypothetical protein
VSEQISRRKFITLLGGAVAVWPLVARAQQTSRVPRVGLLFPGTESVAPARIAALREGLGAVGYREPDQVELIIRVTGGDPSRVGPMASDLVERNVNVLVPISSAAVQAVRSVGGCFVLRTTAYAASRWGAIIPSAAQTCSQCRVRSEWYRGALDRARSCGANG